MTSKKLVELALTRQDILRERAHPDPRPAPARGFIGTSTETVGEWWRNGLCSPGHLYSDLPWTAPEGQEPRVVKTMIAVCEMCPQRGPCRSEAAAANDRVGVRGGLVWIDTRPANHRFTNARSPKRSHIPRPCGWCRAMFTPALGHRRVYCGDDCAIAAHATRKNRRRVA